MPNENRAKISIKNPLAAYSMSYFMILRNKRLTAELSVAANVFVTA